MFDRLFPLWFCVLALCAGCGSSNISTPSLPSGTQAVLRAPDVVQKGKGAPWVQFLPKTAGALYTAIVTGPDGNIWFIDENVAGLVRMSASGSIHEFPLPGVSSNATAMAVGADRKFYILNEASNIARVTTSGAVDIVPIRSGDGTYFGGLALGPDGNMWFAEFNHIGKITPAGKITEYPYPAPYNANQYGGVAAGADGNVWFSESSGNAIGRVVPSTGKITMFPISPACTPAPLVLGNDGNLWFACLSNAPSLGSITPRGTIATYPLGGAFSNNSTLQFCGRGPDGEPWCASHNNGIVFRINTAAKTVTTFTPPLSTGAAPSAVTAGPDGNVWVDTIGGDIDVLIPDPLTVQPNAVSFPATGQSKTLTVSETGKTHWTAVSSNTAVASVAAGGSSSTFKVKASGAGSCTITISDGVGNKVAVKVTVV